MDRFFKIAFNLFSLSSLRPPPGLFHLANFAITSVKYVLLLFYACLTVEGHYVSLFFWLQSIWHCTPFITLYKMYSIAVSYKLFVVVCKSFSTAEGRARWRTNLAELLQIDFWCSSHHQLTDGRWSRACSFDATKISHLWKTLTNVNPAEMKAMKNRLFLT